MDKIYRIRERIRILRSDDFAGTAGFLNPATEGRNWSLVTSN